MDARESGARQQRHAPGREPGCAKIERRRIRQNRSLARERVLRRQDWRFIVGVTGARQERRVERSSRDLDLRPALREDRLGRADRGVSS
jgi:hypothetical protein